MTINTPEFRRLVAQYAEASERVHSNDASYIFDWLVKHIDAHNTAQHANLIKAAAKVKALRDVMWADKDETQTFMEAHFKYSQAVNELVHEAIFPT